MSHAPTITRDDIALAGEYALGRLGEDERRGFEARLDVEPALRSIVAEWREGSQALADSDAVQEALPHIRAAIEARVFDASDQRKPLSLLRLLAGGIAAAAVVAAMMVVLPLLGPSAAPAAEGTYGVTIGTEDEALVLRAGFDDRTGQLVVTRSTGAPADGQSLELWVIPAGSTSPLAVGIIDSTPTTLALPAELARAIPTGTLVVSEEPSGGSTNGLPTRILARAPVERP